MKNRFWNLFLLLTAALMVLLAPFVTAQGREDPHDVFEYDEVDGKAVITRYNGSEQQVTIPGEIDGYTVVAIGRGAFYCAEYITGVTIPGSVREIEDEAFHGCSNLSTVKFANGLVSIDYYAFADTNLSHVRLPDSLKTLSSSAFLHCSNLQNVYLPKGLDDIGNSVFWGCPDTLTLWVYNGSEGHRYAQNYQGIRYKILIESIILSDVSVKVGEFLQLTPMVLPANASNRSLLKWNTNVPDIIDEKGSGMIRGLKPGKVILTATAQDGSGVSGSCTVTVTALKVTGISITPNPGSVEQGKTLQLSAAVLPDNAANKNLTWVSSDGGVATVNATGLVTGVNPGTATITATAQDGSGMSANCVVTVKAPVVFVTGISITPNSASVEQGKALQLSATVLPDNAANKNLTWVSSDGGVATINATGLVTGVNPGTATITATAQDGSGVSGSCKVTVKAPVVLVTGISITPNPGSVEQGKPVQLSATVLPDNAANKNLTWTSSDTGVATVDAHGLVTGVNPGTATITAAAQDGSGVKAQCSLTVYPKPPAEFPYSLLPDGTICIYSYTGSAAEVRVPGEIDGKSVTEIGLQAFYNKPGITKIILPASIRVISDSAFAGCGSLRSINLPEGLHTLGVYVFGDCKNLTTITLPASLTSIGNNVFSHSGLTSIIIPDSVSYLGNGTFRNCSGLTQARLPGKLTSIPDSLFFGCKSLRDVTLPVSLTSIGEQAFYSCKSLTSITIRAYVTSIGESAFTEPLTIYGDVPSAAKEYADKNKIPFVDLAGGCPGDANNDGRVDINDLVSLIDYLVKGAACPSMKNADANLSGGNPDIEDLKTIINMIIAP